RQLLQTPETRGQLLIAGSQLPRLFIGLLQRCLPVGFLRTELLQLPVAVAAQRHAAKADQQRQRCNGLGAATGRWPGWYGLGRFGSGCRLTGRGLQRVFVGVCFAHISILCFKGAVSRKAVSKAAAPAPRQSTIRLAPSCRAISATRGLGTNKVSSTISGQASAASSRSDC